MGDAHPTVDRIAAEIHDPSLDDSPANLFADQSKAFERLGWLWFSLILTGWQPSRWISRAMLALARNRRVQACLRGRPGPVRRLSCSIGMGGTAAPLAWNLGYDPIVCVLAFVLGIRCPTYVDDLAALVRGPRQMFRAQILLLWLSRAAGLRVDTHTPAGGSVSASPHRPSSRSLGSYRLTSCRKVGTSRFSVSHLGSSLST